MSQEEYNQREGWTTYYVVRQANGEFWSVEQVEAINALEGFRAERRGALALKITTTVPVRYELDDFDMASGRGKAKVEAMLNDLGFTHKPRSEERSCTDAKSPEWLNEKINQALWKRT